MTSRSLPVVSSSAVALDGTLATSSLTSLTTSTLPSWLSTPAPAGTHLGHMREALGGLGTVCEASRCPNQGECWSQHTATVLVMGPICTRACRFCHVPHGRPSPLSAEEPARLAAFLRATGVSYAVITSVNRDDTPDHGAAHLAECVRHAVDAGVIVESLIPDLGGDPARLAVVVDAGVSVLAHNIETVERLSPRVRDARASFSRSLAILRAAKRQEPSLLTKSSLMLGLGENDDEVLDALAALRDNDVDIVTLGQYLRPSARHAPVARFVPPERFLDFAADARSLGFLAVASGPLVRSSYRAKALATQARAARTSSPRLMPRFLPGTVDDVGGGASGGTRTPTGLPAGI